MSRARQMAWTLAGVCVLSLLAAFMVPGTATAAPNPFGNGSAWSVPVRHYPLVSPRPNGDVVINTATYGGGVPEDGSSLIGITASGNTDWSVPYNKGDYVINKPAVDANGDHYTLRNSDSEPTPRLVAARGAATKWSRQLEDSQTHQITVGANGAIYRVSGNSLHGHKAADGTELFAPLALQEFASGSYDRLFAYDKGLVIYSGYGKILYVDYAGKVLAGPFTYEHDQAGTFIRDTAASATGDLFVIWYDQDFTSGSCLTETSSAKLMKVTPTGISWTKTLPHVARCNSGGPYVAATPDGGVIVTSDAADEVAKLADIQYVSGAGAPGWHREVRAPVSADAGRPNYLRSVDPAHVDASGRVVVAISYSFDCNVWSDTCWGAQLSAFAAGGSPLAPIIIRSDPLIDPQTWASSHLALTPGRAVMGLFHTDEGANFGQRSYSVDAFEIPGLGAEYPQGALWEMENEEPEVPGNNTQARVTSVSSTITSSTPRWNLELNIGLQNVTCPAKARVTMGTWSKTITVCGTGQKAPATLPYRWKVFDTSHSLKPKSAVSVTASIVGSTAVAFKRQLTMPDAPVWAGIGDSYSSAHHQDRDNISCVPMPLPIVGPCHPNSLLENDLSYSWVSRAVSKINTNVPKEWRYRLLVLAQSGASTNELFSQGQVDKAANAVVARGRTWSVISFTGGANNLNFAGVLQTFYENHKSGAVKPWNAKDWKDCPDTQLLYNRFLDQESAIKADLTQIVEQGRTASPSVRFLDLLYPYVLKSDNVCQIDRRIPDPTDLTRYTTWRGAGSVIDAIDDAHMQVPGSDIYRADLRKKFGSNVLSHTQLTRYHGYPHPDESGHELAANAAVAALP